MHALSVLAQILASCSGLALAVILAGRCRRQPSLGAVALAATYLGATVLVLVDTAAVAAWQLEDFYLILAKDEGLAGIFLNCLVAAKLLGKVGVLSGLGMLAWLSCPGKRRFRLALGFDL